MVVDGLVAGAPPRPRGAGTVEPLTQCAQLLLALCVGEGVAEGKEHGVSPAVSYCVRERKLQVFIQHLGRGEERGEGGKGRMVGRKGGVGRGGEGGMGGEGGKGRTT